LGVGIAAGLGSAALTLLVYGVEDAFSRLPVHWMWWPALGGLLVGIGGWFEPAALGVGYDNIQALLDNSLAVHAIVALLVVKTLVWTTALGSGTSGGVLAPLLIIGGAIGALLGAVFAPDQAALYALLGMAAMMGGTMRSPLTAAVFALELTGNMHALLPLIAACGAAHAVTVLLMNRSILTERLARRGHHIYREYSIDPFETTRVKDIMVQPVDTLPAAMTIDEAIRFFVSDEHRHKSYPIVDERGHLSGIVSRADILRWTRDENEAATLGEAAQELEMFVARADEIVGRLADRMTAAGVGRVPIVNGQGALIGIVARKDLLHARARLLPQEHERAAPLRPSAFRSVQ
jgi:CBS domain-containing protein